MMRSLKKQLYEYPIEDLWAAISNAREISAWFVSADFKPVACYPFTFSQDKLISGNVLEALPPVLLPIHAKLKIAEL